MKVVIITSLRQGNASYCLPKILELTNCTISMVIYAEGQTANRSRHYRRKLKKIRQIGILGALNGIRMRKWYNEAITAKAGIQDIEEVCRRHNIPFKPVPVLNSKETVEILKEVSPDLAISLGNGYISTSVFSCPRYGMLNIHGEILPQFQNAQSVIWQLFENSAETGFTIHKIDKQIDTGAILLQEKFPIIFCDSLAETVAITCFEILQRSAMGLVKVLNDFEKYYNAAKPQGAGKKYTTPNFAQYLRIYRNYKKLSAAKRSPGK